MTPERRAVDTVRIEELADADRPWANELLRERWGAARMVSRGREHDGGTLPALAARRGGRLAGLVTLCFDGDACEVVTLDAVEQRRGVGRALLEAAIGRARERGCARIWLVTTNDNVVAQRFYEHLGWRLAAVHRGALDEARKLKPEIPRLGMGGVPLTDELEYELDLR